MWCFGPVSINEYESKTIINRSHNYKKAKLDMHEKNDMGTTPSNIVANASGYSDMVKGVNPGE